MFAIFLQVKTRTSLLALKEEILRHTQDICDLPRPQNRGQNKEVFSPLLGALPDQTDQDVSFLQAAVKLWLAGKKLNRWCALEKAQNYCICKI